MKAKSVIRGQKLLSWGLSVTWMATPASLQVMLDTVSTMAKLDIDSDEIKIIHATSSGEEKVLDFKELLSEDGESPKWSKMPGVRKVGRTAIIPINGVIYRYADFFTDMCGGITTERLSREIRQAKNDSSIDSIVLEIDSPGGEAYSIGELAHQIRKTNETKPVIAYGDGDVASAAYYLASAAGKIVASPSSFIGCIGTIARIPNPDLEKGPSPYVNVVSTQSPKKVPDFATTEGMQQIQTSVDDMAAEFINDVAFFRGTTVKNVEENYGQGDVLIGRKALKAGMVDSLGTLDDVLEELANPDRGMSRKAGNTMGKKEATIFERMKALFAGGEDPELEQALESLPLGFQLSNPPSPRSEARVEETPAPVIIERVVTVESSEPTPETLELRRKLAEYEEKDRMLAEKEKEDRISARKVLAETFAKDLIIANKAMPVEQASLIQAYLDADEDDEARGPFVLADGTKETRVSRLLALHSSRLPHALNREEIAVVSPQLIPLENNLETARLDDPEAPIQLDERRRLLGATEAGRKVLEKEAAAHRS
jgi:signal peptide peptidase SppA